MYDDGSIYDPKVLDITDEDLGGVITAGIRNVAAACLELNFPTLASAPHSLVNGYKNVLAVAVETEYSFPLVRTYARAGSGTTCAAAGARGGCQGAGAEQEGSPRVRVAAGFPAVVCELKASREGKQRLWRAKGTARA